MSNSLLITSNTVALFRTYSFIILHKYMCVNDNYMMMSFKSLVLIELIVRF